MEGLRLEGFGRFSETLEETGYYARRITILNAIPITGKAELDECVKNHLSSPGAAFLKKSRSLSLQWRPIS